MCNLSACIIVGLKLHVTYVQYRSPCYPVVELYSKVVTIYYSYRNILFLNFVYLNYNFILKYICNI